LVCDGRGILPCSHSTFAFVHGDRVIHVHDRVTRRVASSTTRNSYVCRIC
jgi:hypothetical protein